MVCFRTFGVLNSIWMVLLFVIFITNITPSLNQFVCLPGCCPRDEEEPICIEPNKPEELCEPFCCPC